MKLLPKVKSRFTMIKNNFNTVQQQALFTHHHLKQCQLNQMLPRIKFHQKRDHLICISWKTNCQLTGKHFLGSVVNISPRFMHKTNFCYTFFQSLTRELQLLHSLVSSFRKYDYQYDFFNEFKSCLSIHFSHYWVTVILYTFR